MNQLSTLWASIDPKLKYTVITFAVARLALELGIDWDPTTEAVVAGLIASAVGYIVPNDGTVLRSPADDGNPTLPKQL